MNVCPTARRLMAAGATLCTTALAAAGGYNPSPLMKVTSAYLKLVENGVYGTWTSPSSWSNLNGGAGSNFLNPTGSGNVTLEQWGNVAAGGNALASVAEFFGYNDLQMQAQAGTGITTAGGTATGWLDVVFTADAWVDSSIWQGGLGIWTANTAAINAGDFFASGSTVRFAFTKSWNSGENGISEGISFIGQGASAVPLPGAAGLAACGLVGLSRRRRRG